MLGTQVWDGCGRRSGFLSLSPGHVDKHLLLCPHLVIPLCVYVPISSSYKDTSAIGLRFTIWPRFALITSLNSLSPNTVLRARASRYKFGGDPIQPVPEATHFLSLSCPFGSSSVGGSEPRFKVLEPEANASLAPPGSRPAGQQPRPSPRSCAVCLHTWTSYPIPGTQP